MRNQGKTLALAIALAAAACSPEYEGPHRIRCWSGGELVLDELVQEITLSSPAGGFAFTRPDGRRFFARGDCVVVLARKRSP